jgi:hypothetical protein
MAAGTVQPAGCLPANEACQKVMTYHELQLLHVELCLWGGARTLATLASAAVLQHACSSHLLSIPRYNTQTIILMQMLKL